MHKILRRLTVTMVAVPALIMAVQATAHAPARHTAAQALPAVVAPVPAAVPALRYGSAPWWSASHVIAQTGSAIVELPANRADFSARFRGVGKDVEHAQADATTQAQGLQAALAKYDAKQAGVTTAMQMRALYEQYRDSDGNKVDDDRGDKINGYEVTLTVAIDVRDMSLLEKIFAQMQAASPTSATDIDFSLQPDNAAITQLAGDAIRDARARAVAAADATGVQLGAIRLLDATGRACHSDLLAPGLPDTRAFPDQVDGYPALMK